ncbi:carbohydrate-binding domain-containing protein [Cellulomonas dongxiuzhuiae]|uniref:carbohydrate-binding domain-containing protein n=1 Tax=Cellulomonas dongxiuzhuiae TaxID=2819979 RepID=UPI001AAE56F3|nr:carbohydrate-binding domain-containing protein [Cellulomonas dongxiuzhuiae]MBO3090234.1 carbohydrate-binding domain-containing protein [Cellulomonas dongxiuzhuiae]
MRRGTTAAAVAGLIVTSLVGTAPAAGAAEPAVDEALAGHLPVHDTAHVLDWDAGSETTIGLTGSSAVVTGDGASADGGTVTITAPGTYRVSGTLADGALVVASAGDGVVRVVLDGASITSATTSPLQVQDAGEVAVVLADGSTNTLTDAATYTYPEGVDEPNAALFSSADLTIAGGGALTVTGNANDGIASKDGLVLAGGRITVRAADDGVRGKDYLQVTGGTLDVTATGDGLKSDDDAPEAGFVHVAGGSTTVTSGDDGVTAASDVVVSGGDLGVTAGGGAAGTGQGAKGLVGDASVVLGGGALVVDAIDDAVHSDGTIRVASGSATLATGEDGIDAGERLAVSGGALVVRTSVEGLESKVVEISGGLVEVTATDDAINAADPAAPDSMDVLPGVHVAVSGGRLVLHSAVGDGLDSNGTGAISGGTMYVDGSTEWVNSALDVTGDFQVTGGTVVGTSHGGHVATPATTSPQTWVSLSSQQPAGTLMHVLAPDGTVVVSFRTMKAQGNVLVSSSALVAGTQYRLAVGGAAAGPVLGGYYETPGDASAATVVATATAGTAPAPGGWGGWPPR